MQQRKERSEIYDPVGEGWERPDCKMVDRSLII